MKRKRRAAPPIAAPAIPPGLSEADLVAGMAEEDCGAAVVVPAADEEAVDDGVGVAADPELPELVTGIPLGPRSEYAAQSGLGNARGQLSSWHRE
jgi:hypothetical protein